MTTENATECRPLGELLRLGTYQGMTDAEIDLVLEHKVDARVMSANNLKEIQLRTEAINALIAEEMDAQLEMKAMVEYIMKTEIPLLKVEGNNG